MAIIGIDLGTTNSLVSVWKEEQCILIPNEYGEYLTPSVVYFEEDKVIVGKYAKLKMATAVEQTVSSFKRNMGTARKYQFFKKSYTAPEVSSFIIQQLVKDAEKYLGEKVDEAVISVPAYFNDKQRNATRLAGELAGVTVNRIINEPSAAALAGRLEDENEDKTYLVFDFGGGTLDISIVDVFDNVIEIVSVSGDNRLGGDDFDEFLTRDFCKTNGVVATIDANTKAVIKSQIRQMKHELTTNKEVVKDIVVDNMSYSYHLDDKKIVSICSPLFQRIREPMLKAVHDAQLQIEQLDDVVMVGGSSKMPSVQKFVEFICKRKVFVEENCDYTVARGCGIVTGIISRNENIKDVVLTDICPFTLGVASHINGPDSDIILSPIIERNTVLPVSRTHCYSTVHNDQVKIQCDILQGEERLAINNLKIGCVVVDVPAKPAGEEGIEVRFTYDINGILEVETRVLSTGASIKKIIVDKDSKLSEEQLQQRIKELEILKNDASIDAEYEMLIARGEKLYVESNNDKRAYIATTISAFKDALNSKRQARIRRIYNEISKIYDTLEDTYDEFVSKEKADNNIKDFYDFLNQDDDDDSQTGNLN